MRKFFGVLFMLLAIAMLVGAGWLINKNNTEETEAAESAEQVMYELIREMQATPAPTAIPAPTEEASLPEETPEPQETLSLEVEDDVDMLEETPAPDAQETPAPTEQAPPELPEMPTLKIKGHKYIGYIELPTIDLRLPVMQEWSYSKLKIAPCRYWGSVYDDSMVILAHNYEQHFRRLNSLEIGAPVQFVDAEGNIYKYVVVKQEILRADEQLRMLTEEWDLTLFTCAFGGENRVTIRLERVLAY